MRGVNPRNMGLYVPGTGYVFPQTNQFVNGALSPAPALIWPGGPAPVAQMSARPIMRKKSGCKCGGKCHGKSVRRRLGDDQSGCFTDDDGILVCPGPPLPTSAPTTTVPVPQPSPVPSLPTTSRTPSSSNSNPVASLISAISTSAASLIASTKGVSPTMLQAQAGRTNGNTNAPSASVFSQSIAGVPLWGWGIGLAGLAFALSGGSRK